VQSDPSPLSGISKEAEDNPVKQVSNFKHVATRYILKCIAYCLHINVNLCNADLQKSYIVSVVVHMDHRGMEMKGIITTETISDTLYGANA